MLDTVGLTEAEQTVYLALLDGGPGTSREVRERCDLSPRRLGAVLASLEAVGLVSRLPGRTPHYAPAPPDVALEVLIRAREDALQRSRLYATQLVERYRTTGRSARPEEVVEVLVTPQAILQRWQQLQRGARREVCSFDRPPYVSASGVNPVEEEMLAGGVGYRSVYHREGLDLPDKLAAIQRTVAAGEEARVSPDVPVKLFLADQNLGLLPLVSGAATTSALVVHASSLLDTLCALFELVWDRAIPMRFGAPQRRTAREPGPAPDAAQEFDELDRTLLTLLAAGMTDAAISRRLGWHLRTVQRRVRRLMTQLGADTRFQAGLQANRRGLL